MSEVRITAEPRTEFGKGAARRTRRAHKVPAVLYGHGEQPRHLALPGHDLLLALKSGSNVLLRIDVDGGSELALAKAVQRDPIKGFLEHVDLLLVRLGERVTVDIPVHVAGEPNADALVTQQLSTVTVQTEATHIPAGVDVDITGMAVGDSVTASQLTLPEGVTLLTDAAAQVVTAQPAPTAEQLEAELDSAAAELGAAGVGAAEQAESEAAGEPSGEGDIVPDSDSGAGGPTESQASGTSAGPTSGG